MSVVVDLSIALPLAGAAAGAGWGTFAPGCALWGPLVTRGPADGPPRAALTFDDGPLPGATDRILDLLGQLNVRAVFFVIGKFVEKHPHLVERMHAEGHLVGNHSFDHARCGFLRGPWFWRRQLRRTDEAIERVIGRRPRLFRPPLGIKTFCTARAAAPTHRTVTWSRRAFDGVSTTSQQILDRLVPHTRAGEIIALHDGVGPQSSRDPSATANAIVPLVRGLRDRGIDPVRLDTLTGVEPYAPKES